MSNQQRLTLTKSSLASLLLAGSLSACSILPTAGGGDDAAPGAEKVDRSSLRTLAEDARAAKARGAAEPASKALQKTAEGASKTPPKLPQVKLSGAQGGDEEAGEAQRQASGVKTPADRHAAALALLRNARAKALTGDRSTAANEAGPGGDQGRPLVYRVDPPLQSQSYAQQPQSYGQQQPLQQAQAYGGSVPLGDNGRPVASYPRGQSGPFEPPQQVAQANGFQANGFSPPDPAPGAARQNDPRALMDALERLRARKPVQPARASEPESVDTTGSVAAAGSEFSPASPLTFVQFDKGATVLTPQGQAAIAEMLKPYLKMKGGKVVAAVGLGGPGEAYLKLLQANQRAQAIASAIPPSFEVIRRFDPSLPNESVRLFVVKSAP